jgi:hypothetical protein
MYGQRISLTHLQHIAILVPAVAKSCKPTLRLANMKKMNTDDKKSTGYNITYTQAGVSCFVGKESSKFKVQFFVGSSVVKIPACV